MTRVFKYLPILSLLISIPISIPSISGALYDTADPVALLNSTNFKPTVNNRTNAWVIEFYNTWCGHCRKFAPTWKQFAHDVKSWKSVISVGVIDCAEDINVELCREYDIQSFPSLRFFKPFAGEKDFGSSKTFFSNSEVDDLRESVVDFLDEISWPGFGFTKFLYAAELQDSIPASINDVVLVVERKTSYLGREIFLDLTNYSNTVKVIRIAENNNYIKSALGLSKVPSVGLFTRDLTLKQGFDFAPINRSAVVKAIKDALHLNPVVAETTAGSARLTATATDPNTSVSVAPDQVFMIDLEHAISYTFFNELARYRAINGTRLGVLKEFVHVLARYFPARLPVANYLTKLNIWMDGLDRFTHDEFEQFSNQSQSSDTYLLRAREWVTCRGSRQGLRGYPCSLWLLFHTLTVSAYKSRDLYANFDPVYVPNVIADYIAYFFSCSECSRHFQTLSAKLKTDVTEARDSVLWLWDAHNMVNQRLRDDASQDPQHPKLQFPPPRLCAACRLSSGEWNRSEVLAFLVAWYSRVNATGVGSAPVPVAANPALRLLDLKLVDEPNSIRVEKQSNMWSFSALDMSLCLTLYVCSAVILISVYFVVIVKRRLKTRRQKCFSPMV